jgi:predicted DNA-binding protein with PD1-like motif
MYSQELTPKKKYMLRLERGENVHATIQAFCDQQGITSGWFTALGAINHVELGYYSLEKREYFFKHYQEDCEVVTMVGNCTLVDGVPFLHIHTTISDTENTVFGGHLKSADVAVTLEVQLDSFTEPIERTLNEEIGLKLCALSNHD